jgi:hypothetical protein
MNLAFGEARYADELERALYNGAMAGVSLKGDTYFYMNPLEAGKSRTRWVWHECPCCPPMFLKLMGGLPSYIYSTDADSLYVNLYVSSEATTTLRDKRLVVKQSSRYPWDGNIRITVEPAEPMPFKLMVRIPEWCQGGRLSVNGQMVATAPTVRGYRQIERTWKPGDVVEVVLPMKAEPVKAHPLVVADAGKVAFMRGPLVYCVESADNGDLVRQMAIESEASFETHYDEKLLKGIVVITGHARSIDARPWKTSLYASARELPANKPVRFTAIPYYANANRGPVDMTVWLPEANSGRA